MAGLSIASLYQSMREGGLTNLTPRPDVTSAMSGATFAALLQMGALSVQEVQRLVAWKATARLPLDDLEERVHLALNEESPEVEQELRESPVDIADSDRAVRLLRLWILQSVIDAWAKLDHPELVVSTCLGALVSPVDDNQSEWRALARASSLHRVRQQLERYAGAEARLLIGAPPKR